MPYVPEHLVREPGDPDLQSIYAAAGTINDNLDAIASAIASAGGGITVTTLTGELDSLNTIDGDTLSGGETALAILGTSPYRVARYVLDLTSGAPENLPRIVTPLTNAGTKRWLLSGFLGYVWEGSGAPTVNDDVTSGARQGDVWTYDGSAWVCISDTDGAAVWRLLPALGTGASDACAGNDSRLSNDRTPTAHGSTKHSGTIGSETQIGFATSGGHAHTGSDATKVDHANLLNKGSNDHSVIDTFIASATATPAASKIPIADASAHVDGWVSDADATTKGKVQLAGQLGGTAASPTVVGIKESGGQALALGAVSDGQFLKRSGADLIGAAVSGGGGVINDGRLELNGDGSSLKWDGYQCTLWDGSSALVTCVPSSAVTITNTGNDIFGNPLTGACNYDVFLKYVSATEAQFVFSPWYGNSSTFADLLPWGTAKMSAASTPNPNMVAATSEYSATYVAWKAFTRTASGVEDCWISSANPSAGSPQRIMYDYGSGQLRNVCGYRLRTRDHDVVQIPTAWTLQGTTQDAGVDDAIDANGWTTLDTRSSITVPGQAAWTEIFWCHNVGQYRKFRFVITAANGATYCIIGDTHFILGHAGASQRYRTWAASTFYPVGTVVYYATDGHYYYCKTEHTSGASFDSQYWDDNGTNTDQPGLYKFQGRWVQSNSDEGKKLLWLGVVRPHASVINQGIAWVTSTAYLPGDIRSESSVLYICFKAHTSAAATQPGTGADWQTVWQACGGTAWDGRGVFEMRKNVCGISNLYNPKPLAIGVDNPYVGDTSVSISTSPVPWGAAGSQLWSLQYCVCEARAVFLETLGPYYGSTTASIVSGCSLDSTSTIYGGGPSATYYASPSGVFNADVQTGFHFQYPMVQASSGCTVEYYTGSANHKVRFEGTILA